MNKTELISKVAEKTGLTKTDSTKALNGIIDTISKTLARGEKVTLIGFGTFGANNLAARKGRNPQTGKEINIPARKKPAFKAGKQLKELVNK
ncbi:MAG: HU family DNA-binding protein [Thermodesulfobacteriota bacterium]